MKYTLLLLLTTLSCSSQPLVPGKWRIVLQLNDSASLPFNMDVREKTIDILNAGERITVDEIRYAGDSVFMKMPVFDSELRGKISGDHIAGNFLNHSRADHNIIPFMAERVEYRFPNLDTPAAFDMTGRWEAKFAGDEPPLDISVGEFEQHDNYLTGTFLTSTGDYRYLEGAVRGQEFWLSCFDGSHAYLFHGFHLPDGSLRGDYYSGKHFHDTWVAKRNEKATLPDEDTITYLRSGFDHIDFTFPDADSNLISLHDKKFHGKVVIVQVMGSWCPNCMDETAFLSPFYDQYKSRGVEIIALAFERMTDFKTVKNNLQRLKKRFNIHYTLLFAGSNDEKKRDQALPMLNHITAVPTTISIDRKNKIRRIHTGFTGPATGEHYEKWKQDFYRLMEEMVQEQ